MSSYIHVFARKNDEFVELLRYGRSSSLYRGLSRFVPYEKIAPLTNEQICNVINELEGDQTEDRSYNERDKALIAQIGSWTNTIHEKFEAINDLEQAIAEREQDLEERETAIGILRFLLDIEAPL